MFSLLFQRERPRENHEVAMLRTGLGIYFDSFLMPNINIPFRYIA